VFYTATSFFSRTIETTCVLATNQLSAHSIYGMRGFLPVTHDLYLLLKLSLNLDLGFPLSEVVYFSTIIFYIINKGFDFITIIVRSLEKKQFQFTIRHILHSI
jgi:hypothetical protein